MEVANSIAVVTGAARGIGLAITNALAEAGAVPVLLDTDRHSLELAVGQLDGRGISAEWHVCDVTDDEGMERVAATVLALHGRVDLLVNNAGVGLGGPLETIPLDEWRWILDINLLGVVRGLKAFLPAMIDARHGHLVNVASSVGLFGDAPQAIPYVTTKAALVGMSRALRTYLQPKGLGVTLLCPDNTDTGFRQRAKVVGIERGAVVATLPPTSFQSAEAVAAALLEGLREDRFVVSLTPQWQERLVREAEAVFEL